MNAAPLRVGLIGCGFFAENHLAAWSSMHDVVLAAVCDIDLERARSAAERHKAGAYYEDAAEMLARTAGLPLTSRSVITARPLWPCRWRHLPS